ncbi:MAG: beta-eliminating lyase-related protein [Chloroflexia bacterium]
MPLDPQLRSSCKRFISGHLPKTQRDWLDSLARSPLADMPMDIYGEGPAIAMLEQEVADLLGKEAAVFMHKGVVAQQAALRVWTDRTGRRTVALHSQSHIDGDERNAYERLMGLVGVRVGKPWTPFTAHDLDGLNEQLGVITVELPLRSAGFKLPTWEELTAISDWARARQIPLHFDGARLWESAPFYGRSYAEISALADSVYVSFYKGLGALAGCVLAGPANFIAECRPWKTRLGGNIYTLFPYVLAAYEGLHYFVPKMESYHASACEIATALVEALPVHVAPYPPHTNGFQLFLPASRTALEHAAETIAVRDQEWLFGYPVETAIPNLTMIEIQTGDATEAWTTGEIVGAFRKLLDLAAREE